MIKLEHRLSPLFPGQVKMMMYEHPSSIKEFLLREVYRTSDFPPLELPRLLKTKTKTAKHPRPHPSKILIYLIQGGPSGWFPGISQSLIHAATPHDLRS